MSPPPRPSLLRKGALGLALGLGLGLAPARSASAEELPLAQPSYTWPPETALHPVGPRPWLTWHRAVAATMAGPDASSMFRDTSTALDVRWRLVAAGQEPLPPTDEESQRALNLSIQGASLGLSRAIADALAQSEVLSVVGKVVSASLRPAVVVKQGPEGARVSLDERAWSAQATRAAVTEDPRPGSPSAARPPQLRVGGGVRLVEDKTLDYEEPFSNLGPSVQGWIGLDRLAVEALQLDVRWVNPLEEQKNPVIWWNLAARQRIGYGLSLRADLQSEDRNPLPNRARAGVAWQLPGLPGWRVGLEGVRYLPDAEVSGDEGEWVGQLRLWSNLDWRLPVDIDRWPLGHEIDAPGPMMLAVREGGPNQVSPITFAPAESGLATSLSGAEQPKRERGVIGDIDIP